MPVQSPSIRPNTGKPRVSLAGQVNLRSAKRLIARIIAKVISSMVIESTAIGPQSLLSRKSNMVTEIVLVRAVNNRIVADNSRIDPMKMKIQVAITPLRIERCRDIEQGAQPCRAKDAARILEFGVYRLERCADLLIADRKLLRQIGEEDDRQGAVQNERRLRVAQKESDGEDDAGNGDRCGGQETEIAMSPHQLAQAQIADDRHQHRARGRCSDAQEKRVLERESRLAELEKHEPPVFERKIAGDRAGPVLHECRAYQHAVRQHDRGAENERKQRQRRDLPCAKANWRVPLLLPPITE